jgi:3-deoxy-D-manno-octulosonic-acid transferase
MRFLYTFAWYLGLPLVLGRLWWRGRKEPGYRQHIGERLGFYSQAKPTRQTIWVHAVSVGETRAAEPLINALLDAYPDHNIVLTCMTATGRATGAQLFGKNERIVQSFLPYDTRCMVKRFIQHFDPRVCVLMETEVWPNLIAQCKAQHVPVVIANARLSDRSLRRGKRLPAFMREAARDVTLVAAQTEADAQRMKEFGATNVHVTGSIKFDVTPPQSMLERGAKLRRQIGMRPVLLCASTREGEEELILDALKTADMQDALTVIVPRHPQRFDEVARMIEARGFVMQRRSQLGDADVNANTQILLGDSMGEMFAYYAACDVAFIGGSLLPLGGQNLIEACAVGKPVLIGPHTFNFAAISKDAIAAGAAVRVMTAEEMLKVATRALRSDCEIGDRSEAAFTFAWQHRGATGRTLKLLENLIRQDRLS